jgi:hypothetical protein
MAMSPRKMMAMGKSGEKKTKSAVKLRGGGMVKKMKKAGGSVPRASLRPQTRPDDLMDGFAVRRGNAEDKLEGSDYNEPLKRSRAAAWQAEKKRMGGMVKK